MGLTLRQTKGSRLTNIEIDNNFTYLQSLISEGTTGTSSNSGTSGTSGVGSNGTSGTSGYSGSSGTSGITPEGVSVNFEAASNMVFDFTLYDIFIDNGFKENQYVLNVDTGTFSSAVVLLNGEVSSGTYSYTFNYPILNKTVSILMPKLSSTTVINLPTETKKLQGDFSTSSQNVIEVQCVSTTPPFYLYTINSDYIVSGTGIGSSGTSGSSGSSGAIGTSGTSGNNGSSGTSGSLGTSGTSGTTPVSISSTFSASSNYDFNFTSNDVFIDTNFVANIEVTTGNKTFTISNPILNKVITICLPRVNATTVVILPTECKKLNGDYSLTLQNIIMIHCISISPLMYLYTISQIQ